MSLTNIYKKELEEVRKKAIKLGFIKKKEDLMPSSGGKRYKIKVYTPRVRVTERWIHFGSSKNDNFLFLTLQGKHDIAKKKKEAFHSRFKNSKHYNTGNPYSGLTYSKNLLW